MRRTITLSAMLWAASALLVGCRPAATNAAAAPASSESTVVAEPVDDDEEGDDPSEPYLGVVLAGETVDLGARSDGRIESVLVKPGDHVRKGAVLAVLDRRLIRQHLAVARAQLAEAAERYERRVPLAKTEATISKEELSVSRMQVLEERGRVAELVQALADAELRAPFDGTIAARYLDVGSLTSAGRPVVRVISGGVPRVRFGIPEAQAGKIAVGRDVTVALEGVAVPLTAEVESVAPEIDSAARMVFAVGRLAVPAALRNDVRSGQVAHVTPSQGG